jgi:uncharacterized protein (TIGR00661 family)
MEVLKDKKILIAALDWGIGHATRCVPIIRRLQNHGYEIILASNGNAFDFLKNYFPELSILKKPGYNITYPTKQSMALAMFYKTPSLIRTIISEHNWLKKVIKEYKINEVISDNCYGLWNKKIHSVFITHQLRVKCPTHLKFLEPFIAMIIRYFIKRYDECYIPDIAGKINYSGQLSHIRKLPHNSKFIGLLSRFHDTKVEMQCDVFDIVVLISGPEPHRSNFENKCAELLTGTRVKSCIVRGLPGYSIQKESSNEITWFNHLPDEELKAILKSTRKVVCRPGYSTIMDLVQLGVKAMLVPTPGQTEQEYLAIYNSGKEQFETVKQSELQFSDFLREVNRPAIRSIAPFY